MNISYVISNGKVYVSSRTGVISEREYTDNIKKILSEENKLEMIQDRIKNLENRENIYAGRHGRFWSTKFPICTVSIAIMFLTILIVIDCVVRLGLQVRHVDYTFYIVMAIAITIIWGIPGDYTRFRGIKTQKKKDQLLVAFKKAEIYQKSTVKALAEDTQKENIKKDISVTLLDLQKEEAEIESLVQQFL